MLRRTAAMTSREAAGAGVRNAPFAVRVTAATDGVLDARVEEGAPQRGVPRLASAGR